jgi:hypothetical protein
MNINDLETCSRCRGTGADPYKSGLPTPDPARPGSLILDTRCNACGGSGRVPKTASIASSLPCTSTVIGWGLIGALAWQAVANPANAAPRAAYGISIGTAFTTNGSDASVTYVSDLSSFAHSPILNPITDEEISADPAAPSWHGQLVIPGKQRAGK